jgi:hypothetical protein
VDYFIVYEEKGGCGGEETTRGSAERIGSTRTLEAWLANTFNWLKVPLFAQSFSITKRFKVEYDASIGGGGGNNMAAASTGRHSYNLKEQAVNEEERRTSANTKSKSTSDVEMTSALRKIDKRPRE